MLLIEDEMFCIVPLRWRCELGLDVVSLLDGLVACLGWTMEISTLKDMGHVDSHLCLQHIYIGDMFIIPNYEIVGLSSSMMAQEVFYTPGQGSISFGGQFRAQRPALNSPVSSHLRRAGIVL